MFTNKGHASDAIKKLSCQAMPMFTPFDNWLAMNHTIVFVFLSWFIKFYINTVNTNTLVMLAPENCNKLWGLRLIYWQIFFFVCISARVITKKEGMNVRKSRAVRSFVCALGLSIIYRSATQCKKNVYKRKTNSPSHSRPVCIHFVPNKEKDSFFANFKVIDSWNHF